MESERFTQKVQRLIDRHPVGWFGRFAQVCGEAIHYVDGGSGPALLLIHGFFAWSFTWRRNLPVLAREFRCFAPDLRGWGLSQRWPSGGLTLDDQADMLAAFMSSQGVERAALVGHSMGGEVALRLALRHPERVSGLVLVAPSALIQRRRAPLERYCLGLPILGPLLVRGAVLNRRFAARSLREGYHLADRVTSDAVEGYHLPARLAGSARTLLAVLRAADFGASAPRLPEIEHRSLIVWGENDPWVPVSHATQLAKRLKNSRLVVFPECGHLPHEEHPDQFHDLILPFLRSL